MDGIYFALFVLSFLFLIIGLISPSVFTKVFQLPFNITRPKVFIFFTSTMVIFFVLLASTLDTTKTSYNTPQTTETSTPKSVQYVFDIPTLLGKDVDRVKNALGEPLGKEPSQQQLSLGIKEWSLTFKNNNQELLVTYNPNTRKVIDFFISTDDPSGKTKDKLHLLEIGNLIENDSRYKIEFVKTITDSSSFTGVKIIPAN